MIVAIDGPAGSGKSSVARAIARDRGLTLLDTGAMYRAVTWDCLERGVDPRDEEAVAGLAQRARISFGVAPDGSQTVSLNGQDVTRQIRTPEVDQNVSAVSAVRSVRTAMVDLQRHMGAQGDVIAEGRDIGTTVFPQADVKVFLTADPAARAFRRAAQRAGKDAATQADAQVDQAAQDQILQDLIRRDQLDSTRAESPLRPAEDAHHIDSSHLTFSQVVAQVEALMDEVAHA